MNKFIAKIPIIGKKLYLNKVKIAAEKELESSKAYKYDTFENFLRDCPKYQLKEDSIVRKFMKMLNIEFQQVVFIDQSSSSDKTAWVRDEGAILVHEKGTYLKPWESQKKVLYFDIQDMRPLIDKTKDMDWYNPDACADVVTSITNSKTLENMNGDNNQKYILILLVLVAISIIISAAGIYQGIETQKTVVTAFNVLNNTISLGYT
jgi:aminopeptidase C